MTGEVVEHPRPGVGGSVGDVVLGSAPHEPVAGVGIHDGVGMGGRYLLDVGARYVGIVTAEEQQSRAFGLAQVRDDPRAVEADGGVEAPTVAGRVLREPAPHTEPSDSEPLNAQGPQHGGGHPDIAEHLIHLQSARLVAVVLLGGLTASTEEEVGRRNGVSLGGWTFTEAQQLDAHAIALVDHDDARRTSL